MGNGNKLTWWALGLLATLVIGLSAAWARSVDKELDTVPKIRAEQAAASRDRAALQRQLDRMENKLDRLIER